LPAIFSLIVHPESDHLGSQMRPRSSRLKERTLHAHRQSPRLEFDFPGLRIGVAEYAEGPTGVTVFHFPERVFGVVDTRGGAPGSSLTQALQAGFGKFVDAIVFCGGSTYGLESASGVAAGLLRSGATSGDWGKVAVVPGAVVFDFKGRLNTIYPDRDLGLAALASAREGHFPLGPRGAGAFVHCGSFFGESFMERSGQGAAFLALESTRLAVFTIVNARGVIVDREGRVVAGNRDLNGSRTSIAAALSSGRHSTKNIPFNCSITDSTTLTLVLTNRVLNQNQLQRLAIETHSSMARAIQPFHTSRDGDTLFAATTASCEAADPHVDDLAVYASELAWDAVLNSVSWTLPPSGFVKIR
jgi:L-aminopeptidase/D-esterase-like protein